MKTIDHLSQYVSQRGRSERTEHFIEAQQKSADALAQPADDLAKSLLQAYQAPGRAGYDYYWFNSNSPALKVVQNQLETAEADGKSLWESGNYDQLWIEILPKAWEHPVKLAWPSLSQHAKLQTLHAFSTWWALHELDIHEFASFVTVSVPGGHLPFDVIAVASINNGDEKLLQILFEILRGEAELGEINYNLLRIALRCNQATAWQLVNKLLLAAQRQEGLRQTIVHELPDAHIGAKILLLTSILDNGLQRFASVLMYLQNWMKLPLADGVATTEKNIERLGRLAVKALQEDSFDLEAALRSSNLTECYFQLWASLQRDGKDCLRHCASMMNSSDPSKRAMTLYVMSLQPKLGFLFAKNYLHETDPMVCWNIYKRMESMYSQATYSREDGSFEFMERLVKGLPDDGLKNPNPRYEWENYAFSMDNLFVHWADKICRPTNRSADLLPYSHRMNGTVRRLIFVGHFQTVYNAVLQSKQAGLDFQPTEFERDWIHANLQDKSTNVSNIAFQIYSLLIPLPNEVPTLFNLLTRKNDETRKGAIAAVSKLDEKDLQAAIQQLLIAKTEEQRTAGLDLLQQLKKQGRLTDFLANAASAFAERKSIGAKEQLLLNDLLDLSNEVWDASNGYGLYDPAKRDETPVLSAPTTGFFVEKMYRQPMFGLSVPMEKLETELRKLDALFVQHENYEYEVEAGNKSVTTVLLCNSFLKPKKYFNGTLSFQERLDNLPLGEVWGAWYAESGLCPFDIYLLIGSSNHFVQYYKNSLPDWLQEFVIDYSAEAIYSIFNSNSLSLKYPRLCFSLLQNLQNIEGIEALIQSVELDLAQHYFASIPTEKMNEVFKIQGSEYTSRDVFQRYLDLVQRWYMRFAVEIEPAMFRQLWAIKYWYYRTLPANHPRPSIIEAPTLGRAYEMGLVSKDECYHIILSTSVFTQLLNHWDKAGQANLLEKYPIFKEFLEAAVPKFLEIELRRGDTKTPVSDFVHHFTSIHGLDYFIKIIKGLGKDSLHRGYAYGGNSKQVQFSRLLKNCHPAPGDSYEAFKAALDASNFPKNRLVQVALYAPQWLPWTERYLQWPGLENAAWCLHAHAHNHFDVQKASEMAKYTSLPTEDFADGAVDVAWFREAHEQLGAERWEQVYTAAHYISDNQGYIRARVYADAILGKLTLSQCKSRVSDKRNKDYVVAIGLVPLPEKEADAEMLERYRFLQEFIRQGKDFGQQRQASEKRSGELAFDNLARTAGFPDPIRLTWAMETLDLKEMLVKAQTLSIDGTTIQLEVNAMGRAELLAKKGDKKLTTIPPALKKNPAVQALSDTKNKLNNQHGRIKKSLEEAMIRGDVFQFSELENLMGHPVIRPLMTSLVLVSDKKLGFFDPKGLRGANGKIQALKAGNLLQIAHCCDLQAAGQWAIYQKHLFQQGIVQPFKQVFRELYLPSTDELASPNLSNRYAGYQVQTGQAAALFKTRGWSVRYGEGLHKAFHQQRIVATVDAYGDWFNARNSNEPAEIQTIGFQQKGKWINLPLKDIPAPIFSEVMRDLDLVVSVAHVGGVDPEASLSSIALRAAIVAETAALFGLKNVRVEKNHVFIEGKKGSYSLHLGSGIVHKKPSQMLYIMPAHTQARGRLFLPFVDEDPRTAEVVSKMLLLAKDGEIKDPTVLGQI
jgi:hypothetical protein